MQQRRMGRTGLKVSEICLGTMTFAGQCDEATSFRIMDAAVEQGVTFFDTADVYPIPPDLATAGRDRGGHRPLAGRRAGPARRARAGDQVPDPRRPGPNDQGLSRRHILDACEASLRRLRTDYIDLYQAHSPDPETPIDETLRAFDDLVRSGKVRYVGCSNYAAWQLALALGTSERHGWARYDCVQPRYNVLYRDIEAELLAALPRPGGRRDRLQPAGRRLPHRQAFGRGTPGARDAVHAGRLGRALPRAILARRPVRGRPTLKAFCRRRGWDLATASVAWVLQQPGITSAIVGASRPEQLDATLAAADLTLDDEARPPSMPSGGRSPESRRVAHVSRCPGQRQIGARTNWIRRLRPMNDIKKRASFEPRASRFPTISPGTRQSLASIDGTLIRLASRCSGLPAGLSRVENRE